MVDRELTSWDDMFSTRIQGSSADDGQRSATPLGRGPQVPGLFHEQPARDGAGEARGQAHRAEARAASAPATCVDEIEGQDGRRRGRASAVVWSGDALYAMDKNETLDYCRARRKAATSGSTACASRRAARTRNAPKRFIDFMCREDIAQMNMDYIYLFHANSGGCRRLEATRTRAPMRS